MNEIQEQVKAIKQSFRLLMDGKTAQSMRDKGVNYKLNWGASLPMLREKAEELRTLNAQRSTNSPSPCGKRMCASVRYWPPC